MKAKAHLTCSTWDRVKTVSALLLLQPPPPSPSRYDFPFADGPNVFFLGAAGGWGLDLSVDEGFLALGCRDLRPRISQNLLHWCKTLNWSMKEVAQFPLKPLYLQRESWWAPLSASPGYCYTRDWTNTHPFLVVAIPTSVSLIPTPEKTKKKLETVYFKC